MLDTQYVTTCNIGRHFCSERADKWKKLGRLVSLIEKWNEIEKVELLRSKVAKPIRDGAEYKGDYTQNCIEWVNFLFKNEIDAGDKNYHKCITIHEAINRLKDRFLRLSEMQLSSLRRGQV